MVIKKLNNFFHKHSRILFGAFTLLIILAFTDFLSPANISGCDSAANTQVGVAFGEKVTADDLQKTYRDLALYAIIAYGQEVNFDARGIFYQHCLIKRAEQLGITVSDADIAEKIKASPVFGGDFSLDAYDKFLKERNLDAGDLKEAMRQNMKVEKMQQTMRDSVVVSEAEAKAMFMNMEQKLTLDVSSFKYASFAIADPTKDELAEFFKKYQDRYVSAGILKTVSAIVPFAKYKEEAAKKVTDKMISGAKKANPNMSMTDEQIKDALTQQIASGEAQKEAMVLVKEFSSSLKAGDPADKQIKSFRDWAAEKNLEVVENDQVAFNPYNVAMQEMPLNGSRLVEGYTAVENGIAIVMLKDRIDPKQQELKDVEVKVIADYKSVMQSEKAKAAAEAELKKLSSVKDEARRNLFKTVGVHRQDVFPQKQMSFVDVYGMYMRFMPEQAVQFKQMYTQIMGMNVDDLSPVTPAQDGMEIFMVVAKKPADEKDFEARKAFYMELIRNEKAMAVFSAFDADMQKQCQFTMAAEENADNKAGEQAK